MSMDNVRLAKDIETETPLTYVRSVSYQHTADRRNKRYKAVVYVLCHECVRDIPNHSLPTPHGANPPKVMPFAEPFTESVQFVFWADRPKNILSQEEAFDAVENVLDELDHCIAEAYERREESKRHRKVAEQAERVAGHVAGIIGQRARKAMRYEQRLAALKAELEEELKEQAWSARREGLLEEFKVPDDFDPDARRVAGQVLNDFVAVQSEDGIFRKSPRIDPERVELLIQAAEEEE